MCGSHKADCDRIYLKIVQNNWSIGFRKVKKNSMKKATTKTCLSANEITNYTEEIKEWREKNQTIDRNKIKTIVRFQKLYR